MNCNTHSLVLVPAFLMSTLIMSGQNRVASLDTDSLREALRREKNDSARVIILEQLSQQYAETNLQEAITYGGQARELALRLKLPEYTARISASLGLYNGSAGDYGSAEQRHREALRIYSALGDKAGSAASHANLSLMRQKTGDMAGALSEAFKALALYEETGNHEKRANVLENIGTIYLELKEYVKALDYYKKALLYFERSGNKAAIARNHGNQAIIHNAQGAYEQALKQHRHALHVNTSLKRQRSTQVNLANIGISHSNLGRLDSALHYHQRALGVSQSLGDPGSIAINLGNIGDTYYNMATGERSDRRRKDMLSKAIMHLQRSVALCDSIRFMGPYVEFSKTLSDASFMAGDFRTALRDYRRHVAVKDSLYSGEMRARLATIEAGRTMDLKNRELELRNRELEIRKLKEVNSRNERVIFIICIGLLLIIVLLLFRLIMLRMRRHRRTLNEIANIHSHEVRAPLARIMGLVSLVDRSALDRKNQEIFNYISQSANDLDHVIRKTVSKSADQ